MTEKSIEEQNELVSVTVGAAKDIADITEILAGDGRVLPTLATAIGIHIASCAQDDSHAQSGVRIARQIVEQTTELFMKHREKRKKEEAPEKLEHKQEKVDPWQN